MKNWDEIFTKINLMLYYAKNLTELPFFSWYSIICPIHLIHINLKLIFMNNHFDLSINYNGRHTAINVQVLSSELPRITYSIRPKDEELKKHFKNVKQFYFHINSEINYHKLLEIRNYIIYDYIDTEIKNTDVLFEFAVWNTLLKYNI